MPGRAPDYVTLSGGVPGFGAAITVDRYGHLYLAPGYVQAFHRIRDGQLGITLDPTLPVHW